MAASETEVCETREAVILKNHGQKIFGVLHRPLNLKHYPAVLICHGLAGHKVGRYRLYVILSKILAESGIASLRIDFRGSGDSEGKFSQASLATEVSDALVGLDFLDRDPNINKDKIGLFGRSVGGTVALMTARQYGKIKSLAVWAPIFDGGQWEEKWHYINTTNLPLEKKHNMMRINGQIPGPDFYEQLFSLQMELEMEPLKHTPLLHIHGEIDNIINTEHANKYFKLRQNADGENKFIRLPKSDHDFTDPLEQQIALKETCQWFVDTL